MDKKHRSLPKSSSQKPQKITQKHIKFSTNTLFRGGKQKQGEEKEEDTHFCCSTLPSASSARSPSPCREVKLKAKKPSRLVTFSSHCKGIHSRKTNKNIGVASECICKSPSDLSSLSEDCNEDEEDETNSCVVENEIQGCCNVSDLYPKSSINLKEAKSEENLLRSSKESIESEQLRETEKVCCKPPSREVKIKAKKPSRLVKLSSQCKGIHSRKTNKNIGIASECICKSPSDLSSLSEDCDEDEEDDTNSCVVENELQGCCNVSDSYPKSPINFKEAKSEENLLRSSKECIEREQLKDTEKVLCECNAYSDAEISSSRHPSSRKRTVAPIKKCTKGRIDPFDVREKSRRCCSQRNNKREKSYICAHKTQNKQNLLRKCCRNCFSSRFFKKSDGNPCPHQMSSSTSTESMGKVKGFWRSSGYDPHKFRVVDKPTNYFETLVHLVKCSLGTGILAMPQAFANSGFLVGIIFTIIIGIIINHCVAVLIRCKYVLCKQRRVPNLTYAESMTAAMEIGPGCIQGFSRIAGIIVNVFIIMLQLGICCVYIVFVAGTIKQLVDPHYVMRIEMHMLLILGPLLLANCIPNLKILAPYSLLANVLIIASIAITIYFVLSGAKKTTESIEHFNSIYTFPLFFGTVLFSLLSIAVVISLEGNMKNPKDMLKSLGVLNVGMVMILTLYVSTGAIGYLFCKSKCSDSIVFDLPNDEPVTMAVLIMYAIAMVVSHVLQCYVPIEIIWHSCIQDKLQDASKAKRKFWKYFLRIAVCVFTLIFALVARHLGVVFMLMGIAILGIMVPALMEFCVISSCKFSLGKYMIIIKDIMLFCIGLTTVIVFIIATC